VSRVGTNPSCPTCIGSLRQLTQRHAAQASFYRSDHCALGVIVHVAGQFSRTGATLTATVLHVELS